MSSKSVAQLAETSYSSSDLTSSCSPALTNQDMSLFFILDKLTAYDNKTLLNPASIANPCGLIAKSFFNDEFAVTAGPVLFGIS